MIILRQSFKLIFRYTTIPFLAWLLITVSVAQLASAEVAVPDELLIGIRPGVSNSEAKAIYVKYKSSLVRSIPAIRVHVLKVPSKARDAVKNALSKQRQFSFVEKNFLARGTFTPNDPSFSSQWHHSRISSSPGWDISTGSSQIPIAIIDSGVDSTHPDLAAKVLSGYSFLTNTTNSSDVLGHGTAVAGAAAATGGNSIGIAGVALQNTIMPLVVLDSSNYASYANIASAITYAADRNIKVINISIIGSSYSSTLQSAVDYAWGKGAVIIAAAGNNANTTPGYPAALNNVLAISATNSSDGLASFSSYGSWIDLSAPGQDILTTNSGGGYGYWWGTSFASPITAGLVGLLFSANSAITNADIVNILKQNSDDLGSVGYDSYFGFGRINVAKALQAAKNFVPPNPPTIDNIAPTASISSPSNNTTVTRNINVLVAASDNVGVSKVELYLDDKLYSSTTIAPYVFSWNTKKASRGLHKLQAKAYDAAGNIGVSTIISVYK